VLAGMEASLRTLRPRALLIEVKQRERTEPAPTTCASCWRPADMSLPGSSWTTTSCSGRLGDSDGNRAGDRWASGPPSARASAVTAR